MRNFSSAVAAHLKIGSLEYGSARARELEANFSISVFRFQISLLLINFSTTQRLNISTPIKRSCLRLSVLR